MARYYNRLQILKTSKPATNPPDGFVELFADVGNSGRLTYLFSDGSTAVINDLSLVDGGGAGDANTIDGGVASTPEFVGTLDGGGA